MESKLSHTSIIIVTYNHENFIRECLESLMINKGLEIIVVDNGSSDSTVKIIEKFPSVKLIKNENKGYGNGVNTGIKYSKRKYVVILNPDVKVEKTSIEELIKPLEGQREIITVPKTLLYDGSKINTCGNIEHFTGLTFTLGLGEDKTAFDKPKYIAGLSGVCFAIKRELYMEIGGFDESFFLYMEDAELSWNIRSRGLKILYLPSAIIYHDYKLMVPAEKIYHLEKGRYIILRKYLTWKDYLMFLPSLITTEVFTTCYAFLKGFTGIEYKFKAMKEGLGRDIDKVKCNRKELIQSLDWQVPIEQLNYTLMDMYVKKVGNMIYYINYIIILKVISFRFSADIKN
ncbi:MULTISPECIES: glycosyltransferase family 2 protein [Methanobacterium]|uniref:Glycosyltransferase family 2 protein n=1 Tax=Methanobacterium veterum TaxID=408577 RepID=A0A9E5A014_9EURY|nr:MULTISPECIES: glycosyltransferase family 2 protein [Methanobacterium]MCZ3367502.1 glycosyltransferase family 2 protein [Methanobacterium veterum]MCZ3373350.1 glycosyltransferase family 2 protein [Methanobacterium veterum]